MLDVEQPGMPGLGRRGQRGRELLAGQGGAGPQLLGVTHPPAGLGHGDPHDISDHLGGATPHGRIPGTLHRGRQVTGAGRGTPPDGLEPIQRLQSLPDRQPVEIQRPDSLDGRIKRGEHLIHRSRKHVRIISPEGDTTTPRKPTARRPVDQPNTGDNVKRGVVRRKEHLCPTRFW